MLFPLMISSPGYLYPPSYHGSCIDQSQHARYRRRNLSPMSEDGASYLRASLAAPPFHHWLRPELRDLDPQSGRVTIALPLRAEFRRDPKRPEIHGGVVAALIDIAGHAAIAARLLHGIPTVDLRIDYLRGAAGSELLATAEPIKVGRTLGIVDIRVTDDQGKLVAIGRGAFSTREG
jgi:uncharacterized protein (TIGR00369 family)